MSRNTSTTINLTVRKNHAPVERDRDFGEEKAGTAFPVQGKLGPGAVQSSHRKDFEAMAARRFQNPKPERIGNWWYIRIRQDVRENGELVRKLKRIKVATADTPVRQVKRLAVLAAVNLSLRPELALHFIAVEIPALEMTRT